MCVCMWVYACNLRLAFKLDFRQALRLGGVWTNYQGCEGLEN